MSVKSLEDVKLPCDALTRERHLESLILCLNLPRPHCVVKQLAGDPKKSVSEVLTVLGLAAAVSLGLWQRAVAQWQINGREQQ